jgi:hypothetical protein
MVAIVDPHGVAGAGHQLKLGVGTLLDERLGKVGTAQRIAPHRDEPRAVAPGWVTGWE